LVIFQKHVLYALASLSPRCIPGKRPGTGVGIINMSIVDRDVKPIEAGMIEKAFTHFLS
jgi:hypothetical protein